VKIVKEITALFSPQKRAIRVVVVLAYDILYAKIASELRRRDLMIFCAMKVKLLKGGRNGL